MESGGQSVAEQRRGLRLLLVSQLLILCSLVISLVPRLGDDNRVPWTVLIGAALVASLVVIALGVYRLRRLGASNGSRNLDEQAD